MATVQPLDRIIKVGKLSGQLSDPAFVAKVNAETERGMGKLRLETLPYSDVSTKLITLPKANGLKMCVVEAPNPTLTDKLWNLAQQAHITARDRIGGYFQNPKDDGTYKALFNKQKLPGGFLGAYGFVGGGDKSRQVLVTSGRMWWNPADGPLADAAKKYAYFDLDPKYWKDEARLRRVSYQLYEQIFEHSHMASIVPFEIGTVSTHASFEGLSPTWHGVYEPLFGQVGSLGDDAINMSTATIANKAAANYTVREGFGGGVLFNRAFHTTRGYPVINSSVFVRISASSANLEAVANIHALSPGVVPYSVYLNKGDVGKFLEPLADDLIRMGPGHEFDLFGKKFISNVLHADFNVPGWKVSPWKKWGAPVMVGLLAVGALLDKFSPNSKANEA